MSMKEDRAREGKKAKYRKMGFGPMMDSGEIDFGDKHPLTKKRLKNFKKKENPMADERLNAGFKAKAKKAGLKDSEIGDTRLKGGGMSIGQKKLAAKAPPPNKIDAKDFAVLRSEKAKGRGMGLQDESVKPGKVMKAKMGVATDYKKYLKGLKKATDSVKKDKDNKFIIRRMKLMGMPKLSKGGGSDMSKEPTSKMKTSEKVRTYALAQSMKDKDRLTDRDVKKARELVKGKMGGGMMQKPMGYKKGMTDKTFTDPKTALIAHSMKTEDKIYKRDREAAKILEKEAPKGMYSSFMSRKKAIDKVKASKKILGRMGGGMMQKPMGYSKGVSVKARGCKLGRTKPTKIT